MMQENPYAVYSGEKGGMLEVWACFWESVHRNSARCIIWYNWLITCPALQERMNTWTILKTIILYQAHSDPVAIGSILAYNCTERDCFFHKSVI